MRACVPASEPAKIVREFNRDGRSFSVKLLSARDRAVFLRGVMRTKGGGN